MEKERTWRSGFSQNVNVNTVLTAKISAVAPVDSDACIVQELTICESGTAHRFHSSTGTMSTWTRLCLKGYQMSIRWIYIHLWDSGRVTWVQICHKNLQQHGGECGNRWNFPFKKAYRKKVMRYFFNGCFFTLQYVATVGFPACERVQNRFCGLQDVIRASVKIAVSRKLEKHHLWVNCLFNVANSSVLIKLIQTPFKLNMQTDFIYSTLN